SYTSVGSRNRALYVRAGRGRTRGRRSSAEDDVAASVRHVGRGCSCRASSSPRSRPSRTRAYSSTWVGRGGGRVDRIRRPSLAAGAVIFVTGRGAQVDSLFFLRVLPGDCVTWKVDVEVAARLSCVPSSATSSKMRIMVEQFSTRRLAARRFGVED